MDGERKDESRRMALLCIAPLQGHRWVGAPAGTIVVFIVAATLFSGAGLAGQGSTEGPGSPRSPQSHAAQSVAPQTSLAALPAAQSAPAVSAAPAAPPLPDWPANDRPSDATVTWDSQGLHVVAANSSLTQILRAISVQTGATLEGLNKDERVFGVYGPGPARDVIGQLLDGSGYNVLMVGELGQGTPRQIILTVRATGGALPGGAKAQSSGEDEDAEAEQEAEQPPQEQPPALAPPPPPGAAGVPARSRDQILQDLQQRQQQQLQRQQQIQQQLNQQ